MTKFEYNEKVFYELLKLRILIYLHNNVIALTHGQETCASFIEQVDLPEILRNIALL